MLTAAQLKLRQTGIGASDVPAILGIRNPGKRTIADVWARKRRGPELELPPYVVEDDPEPETCDAFAPFIRGDVRTAGSVLEGGLADLYVMMTGFHCLAVGTQRSAVHPWALATPDRIVGHQLAVTTPTANDNAWISWPECGVDRGLEIKLVGAWAARDWPLEGIADHVRVQCQWGMYVTGLRRWDTFALVGGSEPRIVRVARDDDMIGSIADVCEIFWHEYVLGNKPPPPPSPKAALELVKAVWREDNGKELERPEVEIASAVARLVRAQRREAAAKLEVDQMKALLGVACGPYRSIVGPWGRFAFGSRRGNVAWRSVAEELAEGVVPDHVIEKHRQVSSRRPQLYPNRKWVQRAIGPEDAAPLIDTAEEDES